MLGLWILAALVTAVSYLDASVVLLTPVYVRIARRSGLDPLALGFQPVLSPVRPPQLYRCQT